MHQDWANWPAATGRSPPGEWVRTFCTINTKANELVGRGASEAFSVRTTRVGEEEPGCAPQRARAAGGKRLEDSRAQATRGVLREGPPSPAGTHGENRVAESRLREIMTTLGVELLHNFARNQATTFAASYAGEAIATAARTAMMCLSCESPLVGSLVMGHYNPEGTYLYKLARELTPYRPVFQWIAHSDRHRVAVCQKEICGPHGLRHDVDPAIQRALHWRIKDAMLDPVASSASLEDRL